MMTAVTQNKGLCSIEISNEGVALAYAPNPTLPEITICEFQPYQNSGTLNNENLRECLTSIVVRHNLRKSQCVWVLNPNYYRLTLVDTPNVPQSEYKTAIRWQIKDIISYPLEDATIDIFYPDEPERTLKKVFVIVAQISFLQNIVDIIQECELYPTAIDVREFAIRNLITKLAAPDETLGLISLTDDSCLLLSVKHHNIQFVRRIPVGLKNITKDNYSDLTTEIERSCGYCLTELKQDQPNRIFIPPKIDLDPNLIQSISKTLNKEVTILDLQKIATFKTPINQQTESRCWVAVGGVLRNII